jgi:hypothetical protein
VSFHLIQSAQKLMEELVERELKQNLMLNAFFIGCPTSFVLTHVPLFLTIFSCDIYLDLTALLIQFLRIRVNFCLE